MGFETVKIETNDQDHAKNWDFRVMWLLRLGYWHCKEILDCWDLDVEIVKIETFDWALDVEIVKIEILIETMSKIETLRYQGSIKTWFCNCQEFLNCWDLGFETFKIECLVWDHVKNRD